MMNVSGNTILITGGATGIGLAIAGIFIERGNRVAICGRRQEKLNDAKQKFPELKTYCCDVSDVQQRQKMHNAMIDDGMAPNVLINNAAIMNHYDLANSEVLDMEQVANDVHINLLAPIALINLFLPTLKKQSDPVIINVTSPGGVVPLANVAIYCASKAAINSYTKSLRFQLKGTVEVIEMYPPSVDTAMMDGIDLPTISTDKFASELFKLLDEGGESIWVGEGKYLKWINRISPSLAYWLVNRSTQAG